MIYLLPTHMFISFRIGIRKVEFTENGINEIEGIIICALNSNYN